MKTKWYVVKIYLHITFFKYLKDIKMSCVNVMFKYQRCQT